ncbi:MAG: aspartate/glutamate racemase family protein [Desulfobacteraceae bacterium]|jgi:aspartate racemase|nr:aspartate/glutamate racemase family protein [Desulfobacteraceae bacterium]
MKTIGLLGGMSWESTAGYYRMINEGVKQRLGGLHSAEIVLYSVDFDPIERLQREGDWEGAAAILSEAALRLESAGAAFLLICTNTMHLVSASIEKSVRIPLLHIADATADVLVAKGVKKVGLLGTAFTMEHDFYKGRLQRVYGVEVVVPGPEDRKTIHDVIFQELCLGRIRSESKAKYLSIIEALAADGAEGVILGCTEIGMLVSQEDTKVPLFDTTVIHSQKAVEQALLP